MLKEYVWDKNSVRALRGYPKYKTLKITNNMQQLKKCQIIKDIHLHASSSMDGRLIQ